MTKTELAELIWAFADENDPDIETPQVIDEIDFEGLAGRILEALDQREAVTMTDCLAIAEKLQRASEVLSPELLEGAPAFTTAKGAEEYYLTIRGKEVEVWADLLFNLQLPKRHVSFECITSIDWGLIRGEYAHLKDHGEVDVWVEARDVERYEASPDDGLGSDSLTTEGGDR